MLSLLTIITLASYSIFKLSALISYSDYKIQVSDLENYYVAENSFGYEEQGYMIAAGFTDYDGSDNLQTEDPSIALLKFYKKVYNSSDPSVPFGFHEIPTRFCN